MAKVNVWRPASTPTKGENTMGKFDRLGKALDRQAWLWLQDVDQDIAAALEAEVSAGADPEAIRRFIVAHAGVNRIGIADRCEAAARHLLGAK